MKKDQIRVGGVYEAQIDGVQCHVEITAIEDCPYGETKGYKGPGYTLFHGVTTKGMRRRVVKFKSAAKFKKEVAAPTTPKLKHSATGMCKRKAGEVKLVKKTEDEKRPDPIQSARSVESSPTTNRMSVEETQTPTKDVENSGEIDERECLGYSPNLATGVCRCAVCRSKPHALRTRRPFVDVPTVEPTTAVRTPTTPSATVSSGSTIQSAQKEKMMGPHKKTLKQRTSEALLEEKQGQGSTGEGEEIMCGKAELVSVPPELGKRFLEKKVEGEDSSDPQSVHVPGVVSSVTGVQSVKPEGEKRTPFDVRTVGSASTLPGPSQVERPTVSAVTGGSSGEDARAGEQWASVVGPGKPQKSVLSGLSDTPFIQDTAPHLIVEARAGTGKTTTLIEGLKVMLGFGTHITPSPQQQCVWDSLMLSKGVANRIGFVAFNRSIAAELKRRVPPGVEAMTMHGLGFRAVGQAFRLWGGDKSVNQYRVSNTLEELLKTNIQELRKTKGQMLKVVEELVGLCKVNLVGKDEQDDGAWSDKLDYLISYFDIEMDGTSRDEVYPLVPQVLQRSLDVGRDRCIDYTDMIWLPVVLDLPMQRYDLLLVDERQDLNRCQMHLAMKAGDRIVAVGDTKQAIYGFAGADPEACNTFSKLLAGTDRVVQELPLTVTRRCGKAIVKEANKIVVDFTAHESNPEGVIRYAEMGKDCSKEKDYRGMAQDGDMVLCRVNAPLVSECFRFIKAGRKANIQGRDVGRGLVKTVERMKAGDVGELVVRLEGWTNSEIEKERKKKYPSEGKIIGLQDKLDCLMCFVEGVDIKGSPAQVVSKIEAVFTDDKNAPGIRLSSGHRAKGLESDNVFILMPEGAQCPHPMARTAWQREQEDNILYVMTTRAIKTLTFVS